MNIFRFNLFLLSLTASAATLTAQTVLYAPSGAVGSSSNGNVGVGTSSPAFKLEVVNDNYNAIRATGNSTNSVGIYVQNTVTSGHQFALLSSGGSVSPVGSFLIWDDTVSSARLVISPSGNVGLGTTSPAATLDVFATGTGSIFKAAHGGSGGSLLFESTSTTNARFTVDTNVFRVTGFGNTAFYADTYSGSVGIGTATPAAALNVVGNVSREVARFQGSTDVSNYRNFVSIYTTNPGYWWELSNQDPAGNGSMNGLAFRERTGSGSSIERVYFAQGGNVGIGTTSPGSYKLAVNGTIHAKEVIVDLSGWSDYVFSDNYRLAPLSEIETHIKAERHLPGIPSAQEVAEHGVSMGEMQAKLLAKIEELTLHMIAQEKRVNSQAEEMVALKSENAVLRGEIKKLNAPAL